MRLLGVPVPGPLSVVGTAIGTVRGAATLVSRSQRHVWARHPGRLYIETHGVQGPDGMLVARKIEVAVEQHPQVEWARVNAPSSRVVIGLADPPPRTSDIVRIIERAESEPACPEEAAAEDEFEHPADGRRGTRLLPTIAADALGIGLSLFSRIAPWAPLPTELAALPGLIDSHPALRERTAHQLHSRARAESATSMLSAIAQGLAEGNETTIIDIVQQIGRWREARAQERVWCDTESTLVTGPESAAADSVAVERPMPLPDGRVEQYQRRVLGLGAAASTLAVPLVGPRRAVALGLTAMPRAAEIGRGAFASHVGRMLSTRGTLIMDHMALRRMDRLDTLVLDRSALDTGRLRPADLAALPGSDHHAVAEAAWRLFDAAEPEAVRTGGSWRLAPLDGAVSGETVRQEKSRLERRGAATVLGLSRRGKLQALLGLSPEVLPGARSLLAAAERCDLAVHETTDPFCAVRELQAQGRGVLLVSGDRRALGAADCGVGVYQDGEVPAWGAHLLVGSDLGAAVLLVEAVGAIRSVNAQSIRIAQAASGVGAVTALQTGRGNPARRGLRPVAAGAAIALLNAVRQVRQLPDPDVTGAPETVPWHLMPADAALDRLGTTASGLTGEEARRRARIRGAGQPGETTLGSAFLAELANPLTPVLAGGAALSAAVGSPVDAALVAGVVGLSALVGGLQQVHTERQLADLLRRSAVSATVLRDGDERVISAEDLVPGDVVALAAGDVVPADCRILEADGLEADESSLTGESLPVAKSPAPVVAVDVAERTSMLYEGTTVAAGQACAVVVAVGDETEAGRSMAMARQAAPTTGVESRLTELTEKSMPLAVGSAAAVAMLGLIHGVRLRDSLGAAVNLAVGAVPEGLPFLVNAAQLAAARRLAEYGALVRNPRSIEALGRVDVLCFDKTGTLTEGKLSVSEIDDGHVRHKIDALDEALRPVLAAALRATPNADKATDLPHATDRAVAEAGRRLNMTPAAGAQGWHEVVSAPFEPTRGYHAAVGRTRKGLLLSVKGAPEAVLPRCALDGKARKRLMDRMRQLAQAGRRVLAVAERSVAHADVSEDGVRELNFVGFVAIADPVRGSAAAAAARLRDSGVQIVMITGDHPATGEAIASEISRDRGELRVVTGSQLDELDDDGLRGTLRDVDVVARCTPTQKVRIIKAYQSMGRTVAMTGDGANDAPAIRLADVGIALGQHGTPAARAAADLVVTDDRLETIIAALVEGRAMWASVRAALGVLLGGNLGEITFDVLGAAVTGRSPLGARQLLLVNLLTDLAPSMAIALRRPNGSAVEELLREGPESSLGDVLYREIGKRAGATAFGATVAWTLARFTGRRRRAGTVALAAVVATQLGQTFIMGGNSKTVLVSGLGSAAVLATVIQTPGLSHFFGCTPLGPVGWSIALGSATVAAAAGLVFG